MGKPSGVPPHLWLAGTGWTPIVTQQQPLTSGHRNNQMQFSGPEGTEWYPKSGLLTPGPSGSGRCPGELTGSGRWDHAAILSQKS